MDKLKKCPFCGGTGSMKSAPHDEIDTEYWIVCHSCAAQGGWMKSKGGAIRMWNLRHLTSRRSRAAEAQADDKLSKVD